MCSLRMIAKEMKGRLFVTSERGVGTTFSLIMPVVALQNNNSMVATEWNINSNEQSSALNSKEKHKSTNEKVIS